MQSERPAHRPPSPPEPLRRATGGMIGKARGRRQKASEPTKPEADTSNEVSNTSRPAALIVATRVAPPGDRWPLIGEA